MRIRTRSVCTALVSLTLSAWPAIGHDGETAAGGAGAGKLSLLIPTLFGNGGLTLANPDHLAHFDSSFQSNFAPFNTSMAIQLTSLPLPSPASGFTYSFDPAFGVYTRSAKSFGPILGERAETIGKERFLFGLSNQHFAFDTIDGISLRKLPVIFEHAPVVSSNPNNLKDIITTDNAIGVSLNQMTAFFTYGITDRLDVSVALPQIRATLDVHSRATIRRIGSTDPNVHNFGAGTGVDRAFSGSQRASGIGDVLVRAKGSVLRRENTAVAFGVDSRLPTGDALNFLGSGGYGIKPFVVASTHLGKVTPHANASFEINGQSLLAGDVVEGLKGKLPNQLQYAVGADVGVTSKLTVAGDVLGNIFDGRRVFGTTYRTGGFQGIGFQPARLHLMNGSIGFKLNPVRQLLITFNLLFQLNQAGLRARIAPLFGISYTL